MSGDENRYRRVVYPTTSTICIRFLGVFKKIVSKVHPLLQPCQYVRAYKGADKSLYRLGGKQATATEDFDFHISYL
jgi:hypothetical protein